MLDFKIEEKELNTVYSLEFGKGEVIGVYKLYDGIEDHIGIKFKDHPRLKYFSVRSANKFRLSSSLTVLNQALVDLGRKIHSEDFNFDLRNYSHYVESLDILFVINSIAHLISQERLSEESKRMLTLCIDSLVLEVSHAYNTSERKAKGIVKDHMRCA